MQRDLKGLMEQLLRGRIQKLKLHQVLHAHHLLDIVARVSTCYRLLDSGAW